MRQGRNGRQRRGRDGRGCRYTRDLLCHLLLLGWRHGLLLGGHRLRRRHRRDLSNSNSNSTTNTHGGLLPLLNRDARPVGYIYWLLLLLLHCCVLLLPGQVRPRRRQGNGDPGRRDSDARCRLGRELRRRDWQHWRRRRRLLLRLLRPSETAEVHLRRPRKGGRAVSDEREQERGSACWLTSNWSLSDSND